MRDRRQVWATILAGAAWADRHRVVVRSWTGAPAVLTLVRIALPALSARYRLVLVLLVRAVLVLGGWAPVVVSFVPARVLPVKLHFTVTIVARASLVELGSAGAGPAPRVLVLVVLGRIAVRVMLVPVGVARATAHVVRVALALPRLLGENAAEGDLFPVGLIIDPELVLKLI